MIDLMTTRFHPLIVKTLTWPDEAATQAFAQNLAKRSTLGHAMVELHGDLGAGKTTFVRQLLGALGVTGRIKSPTYAVVEPYELPGLNIWHFDFYRFADPREWEDAGFRDIFAAPGLKLSEWPEKAGAQLPIPDLDIFISVPTPEAWEGERFAPCPPPALRAPPLPTQNAHPAKLLTDNARLVTLTARTPTGLALLDATGAPT